MYREKVIKEFADYVHYFKPYCIGDIEDHEMLKDALALLKGQEAVVRCKDCIYHNCVKCPISDDYGETMADDDWFCADGKRKSADEKLMEEMDADPLG